MLKNGGYKTMENKKNIVDEIIEYFKENTDIYNDVIEELDNWNGYLYDERYYEMEDLNDFYYDKNPVEILTRAFYGYDENNKNSENREQFNPNRKYFYFNGYGNLVSTDIKDYSSQLDEYLIDSMNDNKQHLYSINNNEELSELFDKYDEMEDK